MFKVLINKCPACDARMYVRTHVFLNSLCCASKLHTEIIQFIVPIGKVKFTMNVLCSPTLSLTARLPKLPGITKDYPTAPKPVQGPEAGGMQGRGIRLPSQS